MQLALKWRVSDLSVDLAAEGCRQGVNVVVASRETEQVRFFFLEKIILIIQFWRAERLDKFGKFSKFSVLVYLLYQVAVHRLLRMCA